MSGSIERYLAVKAHGHGKCGTQALILALEQMCGTVIQEKN